MQIIKWPADYKNKLARLALTAAVVLAALSGVRAQAAKPALEIKHLTGDFYVFTTYGTYQEHPVPANGLYLVTNAGVVLIDSPWDTTQFQPLLDSIQVRHHQPVTLCLATHFHEDRTGGLAYYRAHGISTYTTRRTDSLSAARGMKRAAFTMTRDTTFRVGQYSFATHYPGPGHAPDNIVVWFAQDKILYGGCLVKSVADSDLGNLGDANVQAYPATIQNVQAIYKNPRYIIVGHGSYTGKKSLKHTLKLAQKTRAGIID